MDERNERNLFPIGDKIYFFMLHVSEHIIPSLNIHHTLAWWSLERSLQIPDENTIMNLEAWRDVYTIKNMDEVDWKMAQKNQTE